MKAAVFNAFGSVDQIEIVDLPQPVPEPDEILVRVKAAAVNPKDTFIRKGYLKDYTGSVFPKQIGFDFAGEVAGGLVIGMDLPELRFIRTADGLGKGAAGMEPASGRRVDGARHVALQYYALALAGRIGHGGQAVG